ncbi:MAG: hypothetical protein Q9219_003504 [cf. Caloplaca sp. 3 TL-2023]
MALMDRTKDINGIALVVGAGHGIGRQVARALATRGINSLVCVDIDEAAARSTADQCSTLALAFGGKLVPYYIQCDVTDEASVKYMVDQVPQLCGRIDHFILTAGIGSERHTSISHTTLEEWRKMTDSHSVGCFLCIRAVLGIMLRQSPTHMLVAGRPHSEGPRHMSRGSIVIVTSLAAETVVLGMGAYSSAKRAVKSLVETAALENGRKGIRVNAVAPTYVEGRMLDAYAKSVPGLKEKICNTHALGRLLTEEEVADTVVFLTSGAASYMNGQTLVLDGGTSLNLGTTHYSDV